jgi:hypothetical protein
MNFIKKIIALRSIIIGLLILISGLTLFTLSQFIGGTSSNITKELSFVLLPISLMIFIYEYFIRKEWINYLREAIEEETFNKAGGKKVFINFETSDLENELNNSSNVEICIMIVYIPQIISESHKHTWRNLFKKSLEKNCKLKILLLDPNNESFIKNRAEQLGYDDYNKYKNKIIDNVRFFKDLKRDYNESLEVKLFKQFPMGFIYIIGDIVYQGFFLPNKNGLECPIIKFEKREKGPFHEFCDVFKIVWETGKPID